MDGQKQWFEALPQVLPPGKVVGMVVHQDKIIVATENAVYRLQGDELVLIRFQELPGRPVSI